MLKKKVIVVGGGFGGFKVVKKLLFRGFEVLLISEGEKFVFTPLLVEVSTGILMPDDISIPFVECFKGKNFSFVLGKVIQTDFETKKVYTGDQVYSYDYLVLASGSCKKELSISGFEHGLPLKNIHHALKLKSALASKVKNNPVKIRLNVVGAGATGIEYVFAAEQMIRELNSKVKPIINLFDTGSELLPMWHSSISRYVNKRLKKKNISLHSNCRVEAITENSISTSQKRFASDLTVLTVGVVPNVGIVDKKYLDIKNFIRVEDTLKVKGTKDVFALGDIVSFDQLVVPRLAQTAANQARFVVSNIMFAEGRRWTIKRYRLLLKGRILTIGAGISATEIKGVVIKGQLANLIRSGVYVWKIPGIHDKLIILRSWLAHTLFKVNLKE